MKGLESNFKTPGVQLPALWEPGTASEGRATSIIWIISALLITAVVAVVAIFALNETDHQLSHTETADSDNLTWTIAQLEVEMLRFENAAQAAVDAHGSPESLAALRLRYDTLYSRVDTIRQSPIVEKLLLVQAPVWNQIAGPAGLLNRLEPAIDGDDPTLMQAVPDALDQIREIGPAMRTAILESLQVTQADRDTTRIGLRDSLRKFLFTLIVVMGAMGFLLTTVLVQESVRRNHAGQLEIAVRNLRTTIDASRDAILIIDADGLIYAANWAGEKMAQRNFSPGSKVPLTQVLRIPNGALPDSGVVDRREVVGIEGRVTPVEATIAHARTPTGKLFSIAFLRDLSQQLLYEQTLAEARIEAEQAGAAKARFLAVISHEMRTPLNGLLSALELLTSTTKLDTDQVWLTDIVRTCAYSTLEQVNNVLELTRLAARGAEGYPETVFSVRQVLSDLIFQYQPEALRRGNKLSLTTSEGEAPVIKAPLPLFRRVLTNFISNAIKFTRNGRVAVDLIWHPGEDGRMQMRIAVTDTGIGIDAAGLQVIFHNFETLDTSYARMQEGSGLGLGIAKLSAEALGGRISVESAPGKGSCFAFSFAASLSELPLDVAPPPVPGPVVLAPRRILLAEDNDVNRTLLTRQLEQRGHSVTAVSDGRAAVELGKTGAFDIILMDISMPQMDGLTATRILRAPPIETRIPIIAVTAQIQPERVEEFRRAGVDDIIVKPIAIEAAMAQIASLTGHAQIEIPPELAAEPEGLIDAELLHELQTDMGEDFLRKMVSRLTDDMTETRSKLLAAVAASDRPEVAALAHRAAGAAAVLGLSSLVETLRHTERDAADLSEVALVERLAEIDDLLDRSLAEAGHRVLQDAQAFHRV